MNTGAGKTLVGLLALQSSLNEGVAPAVYVSPDNYLARQVILEATDLGISVTDDPRDPAYVSGKAVLVTNIYRVINGKSVFGVGAEGQKLPIGVIVVDDAHACLAVVNDQFKLNISADHEAFEALLKLFSEDLRSQSETGFLDIEAGDPQAIVPVSFWAWKDKLPATIKILHAHRDTDAFRFVWPLLKDVIGLCQCVVGARRLEIAPRCLPIDEVPSFMAAKRRIYMTATLADDGVLISQFQADPSSVKTPIKPKGAGEIGDRMILAPQEINPAITEEDVKQLAADVAKTYNVVVIVPSKRRAELWGDVAAQVLDASNIEDGVSRLKSGEHIGITVLVNKYDGVDLPGDACRLLIIDGLPEVFSLVERLEMAILEGTQIQLLRQIQKLEQGMGRGVRSGEDYCAVLLVGSRLTQRIHLPAARSKFTPATLAQIDFIQRGC
jgi:RAD3-like DEAD/DEAH box helicase